MSMGFMPECTLSLARQQVARNCGDRGKLSDSGPMLSDPLITFRRELQSCDSVNMKSKYIALALIYTGDTTNREEKTMRH